MKQYHDLLRTVLADGCLRSDRTGVGTISSFGHMLKFDLRKGLPLVTTKKVNYKNVVDELLWFLRGETNINTLNSNIWNEWADKDGDLGPIYGAQWVKQIETVAYNLRYNPFSRRHIVDSWQLEDLPYEFVDPTDNVLLGKMALAPCHMMFQCYVSSDKTYLDMNVYQRSQDLFLGAPYNYSSYATLMHIFGAFTDLKPRMLNYMIGDAHIYINHYNQVREMLEREERELPTLHMNKHKITPYFLDYVENLTVDDFSLENYNPHPFIPAPIAR
mgnify:CR=1 FL=1